MKKNYVGILEKTAIALLVIALLLLAFGGVQSSESKEITKAPPFSAIDRLNRTFSLSDFAGKLVVIHITQLENPLCLECEKDIVGQLRELEKLAGSSNFTIITLTLRKNPVSEPDGAWRKATTASTSPGTGWRSSSRSASATGTSTTGRWAEPSPIRRYCS